MAWLYSFQNIILSRNFFTLKFTIEILFTTFLLDNNLAVSAYITTTSQAVSVWCPFTQDTPSLIPQDSLIQIVISVIFSFFFHLSSMPTRFTYVCKNLLALSCFIFSIYFVFNQYFHQLLCILEPLGVHVQSQGAIQFLNPQSDCANSKSSDSSILNLIALTQNQHNW
jgi:hypothetical protein